MKIISKDASLEQTISRIENILNEKNIKITLSKEKNPVKNSYSVNLGFNKARKYIFSNGKGSLSQSSIASAYGEFIERLQTKLYFQDYYLNSRKFFKDQKEFDIESDFLCDELKNIYTYEGMQKEDFIDFNSNHFDKIVSLPFINLNTNKEVFFPQNILANLYASNGLSTGNTKEEANVQALSEIMERYVKLKVIKEGIALPNIPENILKSFPKIYEDIKSLQDAGFIVGVYDSSLGGEFPVTAISFINPKNQTLFLSFGSHPILEVSLERTLTELLQGRELNELDSFETPTFDMDEISSSSNLESHFIDSNAKVAIQFLSKKKDYSYSSWNFTGNNNKEQFEVLKSILDRKNLTIYLREYDYLGFYSCQMIVPNFSEIYPLEDMIYHNKNQGKFLRKCILNKDSYDADELLDEIYGFDDFVNVGAFIGVIFENDFSLAEFKASLLIKEKEYEEAIFYLEQIKKPLNSLLAQILRAKILDYDLDDYKDALIDIYSKELFTKALNILEGKEDLISIKFASEYEEILNLFETAN